MEGYEAMAEAMEEMGFDVPMKDDDVEIVFIPYYNGKRHPRNRGERYDCVRNKKNEKEKKLQSKKRKALRRDKQNYVDRTDSWGRKEQKEYDSFSAPQWFTLKFGDLWWEEYNVYCSLFDLPEEVKYAEEKMNTTFVFEEWATFRPCLSVRKWGEQHKLPEVLWK